LFVEQQLVLLLMHMMVAVELKKQLHLLVSVV
jgi:hypothetical protein